MPNVPVKLYLPEETLEALEEAARVSGEPTPNAVAVDVIVRCLPLWLAAREAFDGLLEEFLNRILDQKKAQRQKR